MYVYKIFIHIFPFGQWIAGVLRPTCFLLSQDSVNCPWKRNGPLVGREPCQRRQSHKLIVLWSPRKDKTPNSIRRLLKWKTCGPSAFASYSTKSLRHTSLIHLKIASHLLDTSTKQINDLSLKNKLLMLSPLNFFLRSYYSPFCTTMWSTISIFHSNSPYPFW